MRRSDADAITASRSDPEAFVEVFNRHFHTVHGYLRRRVGPDLAEDLAASSFTEAFAARRRYDRRRRDALPWLYGIASNLLRRHYRTEERQLRAFARTGVDPALGPNAEPDDRGAEVAAALAALTAEDRETLLLSRGPTSVTRRSRVRSGPRSEPCARASTARERSCAIG